MLKAKLIAIIASGCHHRTIARLAMPTLACSITFIGNVSIQPISTPSNPEYRPSIPLSATKIDVMSSFLAPMERSMPTSLRRSNTDV